MFWADAVSVAIVNAAQSENHLFIKYFFDAAKIRIFR
jgi:hypothetical protein